MFEVFILIWQALWWTLLLIMIIILLLAINMAAGWIHHVKLYIDRKLNQDLYTLLITGVIFFIVIWGFSVFINGIFDFENRVPIGEYSQWFIGTMLVWGIIVIIAATLADITNHIVKGYTNESE